MDQPTRTALPGHATPVGAEPAGGAPLVVPVALSGEAYDIRVGADVLRRLGEFVPARAGQACGLVTDSTLNGLYGDAVETALRAGGWRVHRMVVPAGEASKCLGQAEVLYNGCLDGGLDRGAMLFALGGGVVGDLTGFVAGTFMRGLPFVQVPTTLLAQVDASVGGKTAVDLPRGKNLVGVFHQPAQVIIDVDTLASLPEREFRSGMAEVIKHGAIADAELFAWLEEWPPAQLRGNPACLKQMVARNCEIKAAVVAADPLEKGLRACLNFGHTVGHALEVAAGEWGLRHGEAVALGMVAESRLAERLGETGPQTTARLVALAKRWSLLARPAGLDPALAREALLHDKKLAAGRLRLPLVPEIGCVRLTETVPVAELVAAVDDILSAGV